MKRIIISVFAAAVVIGGLTIVYLLFTGPRMFVQPNIRQFQAVMPVTSPNTVPVKDIYESVPSKEQAQKLLTTGKTDLLEGFISKRGRPFSAYLKLEDGKVGFEFPEKIAQAPGSK